MNKSNNINAGVIVLAAGISKRMGVHKALLPFNKEFTFLERIIKVYEKFGCSEIVLIINEETKSKNWEELIKRIPQNVKLCINKFLRYERFYSVKLGTQTLATSDHCFIQNIDNPFIKTDTLRKIFDNRISDGYVSPRYKGQGGHPILLGTNLINDIKLIKANDLNLRNVLHDYICIEVKINDKTILANINTREEYDKFFNQ